jgi:hypothetical protein
MANTAPTPKAVARQAIRIVAPMPIKRRETENADAEDWVRVLFKGVAVFDRSQVARRRRWSRPVTL